MKFEPAPDPSVRQAAWCPTCGTNVAGVSAGCDRTACLRRELDADWAIDAASED